MIYEQTILFFQKTLQWIKINFFVLSPRVRRRWKRLSDGRGYSCNYTKGSRVVQSLSNPFSRFFLLPILPFLESPPIHPSLVFCFVRPRLCIIVRTLSGRKSWYVWGYRCFTVSGVPSRFNPNNMNQILLSLVTLIYKKSPQLQNDISVQLF